ncbi:PQQ-dependent sugar dehydrogenase [Aeromicrobium sp.]|uniref:PQQ-dependent sugar dehydrogenase n=1 Tax=Aeromicrobium sp. TaxID=1871063 RepID=UPI003D6ABB76
MVDRRTFLSGMAGLGAATLIGCSEDEQPSPRPSPTSLPTADPTDPTEEPLNPRVTRTIASGLNVPWGIVFLANGDALVAQRDAGSIVRVTPGGRVSTVGKVRGSVGGGEGGLLGLALDPDDDSILFAYVTTSEDDRVVRLELDAGRLGTMTPILTGIPAGAVHHGGRMLFDPDGHLFVATGEAGNSAEAQKKDSLGGKVLRIDRNGDAVDGNPFGNRTWSYGNRNIEGLAFDADGRLWASEFGANRFDELNLIERGRNYGWPKYEGRSDEDGFVTPKVTWRTNECSPSGLAITRSTAFVAALQGECLFAVPLDGTNAGKPRALFKGKYGRIRTVEVAPDESLWVTTSNTDGRGNPARNDDRILRVTL